MKPIYYRAIETKYLPATNYRGSRIKASDFDGNTVTLSWDDSFNTDENHRLAAQSLVNKMNWNHIGKLIGGGLGNRMVWVFNVNQ